MSKPNILHKSAVHPMLAILPDYLKDHNNYEKIQRAILDAGATRHSHNEIVEWSACKHCQQKQHDRAEFIRKLGFTSGAQYMAWKKVQDQIGSMKRVRLGKYNSK